jgi:hypothetical protein
LASKLPDELLHGKRPACEIARAFLCFPLAFATLASDVLIMRNHFKILFSILAAAICTVAFAADKPSCQKTGNNCPMNDGKACNCGKTCDCG